MRKTSVRDLHIHTSELVREAAAGAVIIIERRGEPIAEIRPLARKAKAKFPDMSRLWNDFPQLPEDSSQIISEDRDR
jgi:prevent-host-death family protein